MSISISIFNKNFNDLIDINNYKPIGYSREALGYHKSKASASQQESVISMHIRQCSETEMWAMIRDQDYLMSNLSSSGDFQNIF